MKRIIRIVLTGGPAAGKTTLISRILNEFKPENGWRVITIPETATELISGFGIRPFGGCMSMLAFQDFVIADQLHKEQLALKAAEVVDEENILIIYDRAVMDDKAYITDEQFAEVLARFDGRTEEDVLAGYDAVLHLVTCAKGAEFAYNLGNAARTETIEFAREMDDRTLRAWSRHPNLRIIDNSVNFDDKMRRAIREIYRIVGEPVPMMKKRKYLIEMPDIGAIAGKYNVVSLHMMQTYLLPTQPDVERHPPAEERRGLPVFLHRQAHHGRRLQVGHRALHSRKAVRALPDGMRQQHAQRAQGEAPLYTRWTPDRDRRLSVLRRQGHTVRLFRRRIRRAAGGDPGDPRGHRRSRLQKPPAGHPSKPVR